MPDRSPLSQAILRARRQNGWSQEELAVQLGLGIKQSRVSIWERGQMVPTPAQQLALATRLPGFSQMLAEEMAAADADEQDAELGASAEDQPSQLNVLASRRRAQGHAHHEIVAELAEVGGITPLRAWRMAVGLTAPDLLERLHQLGEDQVSANLIWLLETDDRRPTSDQLRRFCEVFQTSPEQLGYGTQPASRQPEDRSAEATQPPAPEPAATPEPPAPSSSTQPERHRELVALTATRHPHAHPHQNGAAASSTREPTDGGVSPDRSPLGPSLAPEPPATVPASTDGQLSGPARNGGRPVAPPHTMPPRRRVRALIRVLRENAGLSQADLAGLLGVRQSSVSQWERGSTRPALEHYRDMMHLFGLRGLWLLQAGPLAELGAKIQALRELEGWSQRELARLLGVSVSLVDDWEQATQAPPLRDFLALVHTFGIDGVWLADVDEPLGHPGL